MSENNRNSGKYVNMMIKQVSMKRIGDFTGIYHRMLMWGSKVTCELGPFCDCDENVRN